jgi:hypothetical protein
MRCEGPAQGADALPHRERDLGMRCEGSAQGAGASGVRYPHRR